MVYNYSYIFLWFYFFFVAIKTKEKNFFVYENCEKKAWNLFLIEEKAEQNRKFFLLLWTDVKAVWKLFTS